MQPQEEGEMMRLLREIRDDNVEIKAEMKRIAIDNYREKKRRREDREALIEKIEGMGETISIGSRRDGLAQEQEEKFTVCMHVYIYIYIDIYIYRSGE